MVLAMAKTEAETFVPLGDAVLVRKVEPPTKIGGLALPESARKAAREQEPRAVVVAVGPGLEQHGGFRRTLLVKPGDTVIVGPGAGMAHVTLNGDVQAQLFVIDYDGILGVIKNAEVQE